jgi:hypothetical protein
MKQPSFSVYLNRKTGEFRVCREFDDAHGLHCETGAHVRFSADQMKTEGVRFAEIHFSEYETRTAVEPAELQQMPLEAQNEFQKVHKHVWVYRPKPDEVVFWPSRTAKRGKRMIPVALEPEDTVHVAWPTNGEKFFENLMAALEKAR